MSDNEMHTDFWFAMLDEYYYSGCRPRAYLMGGEI